MSTPSPVAGALPGALVLSLDFELRWGVFDRVPEGHPYERSLLGAREAIPRMLDVFAEFEVAATWATVGFLWARSRAERERFSPAERPAYVRRELRAYDVRTGESEGDDPLHFAASLIDRIRRTPRQELATHTFSHYYCNEAGQDAETFAADLRAACAIAEVAGDRMESIIFPRNQHNPAYDELLQAAGVTAFRGNPDGRMWRFADAADSATPGRRLARLASAYFGRAEDALQRWPDVLQPSGLADVRASHLLRPYAPRLAALEGLRARRLCAAIRAAAKSGSLVHLWWHPHNFGAHIDENLAFLRRLLEEFAECRTRYGMLSLSMREVARLARERAPSDGGRVAARPLPGALVSRPIASDRRAVQTTGTTNS